MTSGLSARAQGKPKFKLSIAFPETDLRAGFLIGLKLDSVSPSPA